MQRSLSVLLVDVINVLVGGMVGMTILVMYHPYFLIFNTLLMAGFALIVTVLSHGALKSTIEMSHAKYDTLHWLQEISFNLPHFKATVSEPLLLKKTDELVGYYAAAAAPVFKFSSGNI